MTSPHPSHHHHPNALIVDFLFCLEDILTLVQVAHNLMVDIIKCSEFVLVSKIAGKTYRMQGRNQ